MRPFGLPANPRPQSRPLTQVVTHTRLPGRSLSDLSRTNAITRRNTTDPAAQPATSWLSFPEPSETSSAASSNFSATIDFLHDDIYWFPEKKVHEETTEEDVTLVDGGDGKKTTRTSTTSVLSSPVFASPGNISLGLPAATPKAGHATLSHGSDLDEFRTQYEAFSRFFARTARGSGLSQRHTQDNTPPDIEPVASLSLCDVCHGSVSTGGTGASSFLRSLYQPGNASTDVSTNTNHSTSCCSATVCDRCFVRAMDLGIERDFWFALDRTHWIWCPSSRCSSLYQMTLGDIIPPPSLPSTLYSQVASHVLRYARAMECRDALQQLTPIPAKPEFRRAAELHRQLRLRGRMKNPMDPRRPLSTKVKVLPVDSTDGSQTLQVPIFVDLIVPSKAGGRECTVCTETLSDVTDGTELDEASWAADTSRFPGDWNHLIRSFMSPSSLPTCSASHDLDICRNCLSRHLETQLEVRGRGGADSLCCPQPDCGHIYTQEEVRRILDTKTYARYDKLCLLSSLATLPNFRWCLREGCEFGQEHVFATPALPSFPTELNLSQNNRISCDECGFAMCFAHQTPWHEGRDCIEFGYAGEPLAASQAWLRENTKDCPRCHVPLERHGGCFHMTCGHCRFEFCWLCLADWGGIFEMNPHTYVTKYKREGHAAGCFFRREDAPNANWILGNTLEEALRGELDWE